MLYTSLVLSALLLILANWFARGSLKRGEVFLAGALSAAGFAFVSALGMWYLPAVALQALLLLVAAIVWACARGRRRSFLVLSCTVTVVAYLVIGWPAYREQARWREQFAYVSMEERLPPRKVQATDRPEALPAAAARQVEILEQGIEQGARSSWFSRESFLQQLHEDTVQTFVEAPGFGYNRMPRVSEWQLTAGLRKEPPLPQPAERSTSLWSAAALLESGTPVKQVEAEPDLLALHRAGTLDFVNPAGFGYVKDRRHVAGFQEHQFSKAPEAAQAWVLTGVDLIGLALHDEPFAYVSANLPRMDELRKAPTRPLDAFEEAGLAALRGGEELFVSDTPGGRRMLGALRSAKQCTRCHGGERGDLLGAFSYTLVRAVK
jgi:hypothetical protein